MCFWNDEPDWHADVVECEIATAGTWVRCEECRRPIHAGQPLRYIYQQEHEVCGTCDPDRDGAECTCGEPNVGETFEYVCCLDCDKFLQAIEAAEKEAGCPRHASRPNLCALHDELHGAGREEFLRYAAKAELMYPELAALGYLGWLYREVFEND